MRVRTILAAVICVNVAYLWWGAPGSWNPDEIGPREAVRMLATGDFVPESPGNPTLHAYALIPLAAAPERLLRAALPAGLSSIEFATGVGRVVSALLATLLAGAVAGAIRRRGHGEDTAALAATLVGASSLVISAGHCATVDAPAVLLVFLALERAARAADARDGPRAFAVAGFLGGLAVAAKFTALLPALAVPAAAGFAAPGRRLAAAACGALALAAGFAAGMPLVLVAPYDVAATFVVSSFHVALLHGDDAPRAGLGVLVPLALSFGMAGTAALALGLFRALHGRGSLVLGAVAAATLAAAAASRLFAPRYLLPCVAPLVLLAAPGLASLRPRWRHALFVASALQAGLAVAQYPLDARHAARAWLVAELPGRSVVASTPYGPNLRGFETRKLPVQHTGLVAYPAMEASPPFRALRATGHAVGGGAAPQARRVLATLLASDESLDPPPGAAALHAEAAAVVVSSAASDRFRHRAVRRAYPRTAALLDDLAAGTHGLVRAATFASPIPPWLRPPVEWTDASITVYRRE